MKQLTAFVIGFVLFQVLLYYIVKPEPVQAPEPVISKCDSLHFVNDSLIQRNKLLEERLITFKLGLAQLKMVDKKAHDYLINAGNFVFYEDL